MKPFRLIDGDASNDRETLRLELRDRVEAHRRVFADRVADHEHAGIDDTDDVPREGFFDGLTIAGEQP
ncbi:MAG: hypothetical protein NTZ61_06830, partial [Proteobacteria bacterium]|nr:hypothetical protein [Pseudomonadota bacterium]